MKDQLIHELCLDPTWRKVFDFLEKNQKGKDCLLCELGFVMCKTCNKHALQLDDDDYNCEKCNGKYDLHECS